MDQPVSLMVTGDLHLGVHPSSIPDEIDSERFSPGWIWRRIVEIAVSESVDLVVITGDLVDRKNQVFEAWGPFESGVAELEEAGVPLILVAGNHDAEILPDVIDSLSNKNCHLIGLGGKWERWTLERKGTTVLHLDGWSYPRQHVRRNVLDDYDLPMAEEPVLGLLHTDLNGTETPYVPVDRADFMQTSVDAWLLGHIHKPDVLSTNPLVLYPGSPQPLDPSETGLHGSYMVEVCSAESIDCTPYPVSTLQYETVEIDASPLDAVEEVPERICSRACDFIDQREQRESSLDSLELILLRLILVGRTNLYGSLREREDSLRRTLKLSEEGIKIRIENVINRTRPPVNIEKLRKENSPVGRLAELIYTIENDRTDELPEDLLNNAERVVNEAYQASPYEPLRVHGETDPPSRNQRRDMIARQARQLLNRLLRQKDESS